MPSQRQRIAPAPSEERLQPDLFNDVDRLKKHAILCYACDMSNDDDDSVHGLVDSRRAAAILGVSPNTFRVWATRSLLA